MKRNPMGMRKIAIATSLLFLLSGCASGTVSDSGDGISQFPTATLHPVFSSSSDLDEHPGKTGTGVATNEIVEPTPDSRPTATGDTVNQQTPTGSPTLSATNPAVPVTGPSLNVPILLYHHIGVPEQDLSMPNNGEFTSVEQFRAQMGFLAESGFVPIDLYTLYQVLNGTAELPTNPVVITFDGGSVGLYEDAFPILQEYGFPSTFFVYTDLLEDNREGYLTWAMVEEMATAGMRIEIHSQTQSALVGQGNEFLIWQVLGAQDALAQRLGYTPRFIAYPFGLYDDNLIQFLEGNDFWGGLTDQGGLEVGFENRFLWPRLYIPADITTAEFADLLASGRAVDSLAGATETALSLSPLTTTVSLSTTQGTITSPAIALFDEELISDWIVRTSPGVRFSLQYEEAAHSGSVSMLYQPEEDFGSFFLQVRPGTSSAFLRDNIVGVAFWLFTGGEPLALDDLAVAITGSNDLPYWSATDNSANVDDFQPTFDDATYLLGFNRPVDAATWVQVVGFFDFLNYDTDYQYITGIHFINNADVRRAFLIDELVFLLQAE